MENLQAHILKGMFQSEGIAALVMHHKRGEDTNFVELIVPSPWDIALTPALADKPHPSWNDAEFEAWLDSTAMPVPQDDEEYERWAERQDRIAVNFQGLR